MEVGEVKVDGDDAKVITSDLPASPPPVKVVEIDPNQVIATKSVPVTFFSPEKDAEPLPHTAPAPMDIDSDEPAMILATKSLPPPVFPHRLEHDDLDDSIQATIDRVMNDQYDHEFERQMNRAEAVINSVVDKSELVITRYHEDVAIQTIIDKINDKGFDEQYRLQMARVDATIERVFKRVMRATKTPPKVIPPPPPETPAQALKRMRAECALVPDPWSTPSTSFVVNPPSDPLSAPKISFSVGSLPRLIADAVDSTPNIYPSSKVSTFNKQFEVRSFPIAGAPSWRRYIGKFPKTDYAQTLALSRQFLHYDFAFTDYKWREGFTEAPKCRAKMDWKDYFKAVEMYKGMGDFKKRGRQNGNVLTKGWTDKKPREVMIRDIMGNGIEETMATRVADYIISKRRCVNVTYESIMLKFTPGWKHFWAFWPSRYSSDYPFATTPTPAPTASSLNIITEVADGEMLAILPPLPPPVGEDGGREIERTQAFQLENWLRPLQRDFLTPELADIWFSRRLYGKTLSRTVTRITPQVCDILLEILRSAFFNQDWYQVAKSIEGMCIESASPRGPGTKRRWIMWNTGFYSIMRFEPTISKASDAIKKFALNFMNMYQPRDYPRRLGVEVAIWLTQEGRFLEGLEFLNEMDEIGRRWGLNTKYAKLEYLNPKRDQIDYLTNLIRAVHLYALYVRDRDLYKEGLFQGDVSDLRRSGDKSLAAFESLMEHVLKCEGEITAFLPQLVELTIELRSPAAARELLDLMVIKYYGHRVVEKEFIALLKTHFPDEKKKICRDLMLKKKFQFKNPGEWKHQRAHLHTYKLNRQIEDGFKRVAFRQLPKPGFSV